MKTLKALVRQGRLTIDSPSKFPEGTVLELIVADPGDDLDARERRLLHGALERAWESAKQGRVAPASKLVARLRRTR